MNSRSIVVFLLLSVGALSLVQCNTAKSASASNDSPQPVMIGFTYQLKDSGKWKFVHHQEYVIADKGEFIIF